jgi:hypothetical protein
LFIPICYSANLTNIALARVMATTVGRVMR